MNTGLLKHGIFHGLLIIKENVQSAQLEFHASIAADF
jgi:hypothetical protein